MFYDLVVRFRDDTYAFGTWTLDSTYLNYVTSLDFGSFRGINDHNIVIDRKWVDSLYRGLIEDYYFNHTKNEPSWNNAEHRIFQVRLEVRAHVHICIHTYIHTYIHMYI